MSIEKRGDSYRVRLMHRGRTYRASLPTYEQAQAWQWRAKATLAEGREPDPPGNGSQPGRSGMTMAEALDQTYRAYWSHLRSGEGLRRAAELAMEVLGPDLHPAEIDRASLRRLVDALGKRGNSPGTINRKLSGISKILTYCREEGWIDSVPDMPWRREPEGRIRVITHEEEQQLLDYFMAQDRMDMAVFVVHQLDTGMRSSEAVERTWEDYDLRERYVHIRRSKARLARAIKLTPRLVEALRKLRPWLTEREQTVGPFAHLTVHAVVGIWSKAREALDKSDDSEFVPHAMRHTFCSRLVRAGVGLAQIKVLAGHRSLATTQRYAHVGEADCGAAIDTLGGGGLPSIE